MITPPFENNSFLVYFKKINAASPLAYLKQQSQRQLLLIPAFRRIMAFPVVSFDRQVGWL